MRASTSIAIVGHGPVLEIAGSIVRGHKEVSDVVYVELPPDGIADADVASLVGRPAGHLNVFPAIGLHALNHARRDLAEKFARAGYAIASLVHPSAAVDSSARIAPGALVAAGASIGPGCDVGPGAVLLDGAVLESGARVGEHAWIGANVVVGFAASVGPHSIIRSGTHIDAYVRIGHHCEISGVALVQRPVPDRSFHTAAFALPVRIHCGHPDA